MILHLPAAPRCGRLLLLAGVLLGCSWLSPTLAQEKQPTTYQKALAIDPKHRSAHEYIGEAHLELNDVAKAREHLAALDRLCFLPCSQYRDLKKAIETYQARGR